MSTSISSCARAATAEEARYRIDRPIPGRTACVVALDEGAAAVVKRAAIESWQGTRFFTEPPSPDDLADADLVLVIATNDDGAGTAAEIARVCWQRGIMATGLILGQTREAVTALRPYARNLLITEDEDDVAAVLTALRA